jgi:hypothetical protein
MLGAATEAEIAVAPSPASTAARTASFDGNSSWMRNALDFSPDRTKASSKADRVPEHLKRDADGGITLYVQHESPGADKESNWLPAPSGPFSPNQGHQQENYERPSL